MNTLRYDLPHDTYYKYATVEVTFEDGTTATRRIETKCVGSEQLYQLDFDKPITKLKLCDLVAEQTGGWAAIAEIAVYGTIPTDGVTLLKNSVSERWLLTNLLW